MASFPSLVDRPAIPSADAAALREAGRNGALVRAALAAALVLLLAAAVVQARRLDVRQGGFLPTGSSGVVVLDLSTSIEPRAFRRVVTVLQDVAASDQRVGLVLFSDTAYEAVPPGTRGSTLRPLIRYFTPIRIADPQGPANVPFVFPRNPWSVAFRGGTRISAGLNLAREVLKREGIGNGSVLLVSDLDDSFFDITRLTESLVSYRREGIPLRIVPVFAAPDDRKFFRRLVGARALVPWEDLTARATSSSGGQLISGRPTSFLAAAALLLLLLAVNEWWSGRLHLPRRARSA